MVNSTHLPNLPVIKIHYGHSCQPIHLLVCPWQLQNWECNTIKCQPTSPTSPLHWRDRKCWFLRVPFLTSTDCLSFIICYGHGQLFVLLRSLCEKKCILDVWWILKAAGILLKSGSSCVSIYDKLNFICSPSLSILALVDIFGQSPNNFVYLTSVIWYRCTDW